MRQTVTSCVFSPLTGFDTLCLSEFLMATSLCQRLKVSAAEGKRDFNITLHPEITISHRRGFYGASSSQGKTRCSTSKGPTPLGTARDTEHGNFAKLRISLITLPANIRGKIPTRFSRCRLPQTGKKTQSRHSCLLPAGKMQEVPIHKVAESTTKSVFRKL